MKIKYLLIVTLLILSIKVFSQEVRVNNSFIIMINNNLATNVEGLEFILTDSTGKEDITHGGYYPGVLYVNNQQTKNLINADSLKNLTVKFRHPINLKFGRRVNNYEIGLERRWLKTSLIIVRIVDINKKKGTYDYTLEVPGYYFAIKNISVSQIKAR